MRINKSRNGGVLAVMTYNESRNAPCASRVRFWKLFFFRRAFSVADVPDVPDVVAFSVESR